MKKIIIVLAILVAIAGITPSFIGSKVEDKMRELAEISSEHPMINLEITDYQKGWFRSTAKMSMKLDFSTMIPAGQASPMPMENFSIDFTQEMQHGPILTDVSGFGFGLVDSIAYIHAPEVIKKELPNIDADLKEKLEMMSRMAFDGSISSTYILHPFEFSKDGDNISVMGAEFGGDMTSKGDYLVNGTWGGMTVATAKGEHVEIGKLTLDADQQLVKGKLYSPYALYAGDLSMNLEQVVINKGLATLTDFDIYSDVKVNDDMLSFGVVFKLKQLDGMGMSFQDIVYDLAMEGLDVETMEELNKITMGMTDPNPEAQLQKLQAMLPQILANNPSLKINKLGMTTAQGDIDTNMVISIDGSLVDINNPMSIVAAIDATANGVAPEAFFTAMGLGASIEPIIQQGIVVRDADQLKFNFTMKDSQMLLNGNPVPLGALMQ